MKTAETLQRDVVEELAWDPEVDSSEIGVFVENGVVTLTGSVSTYAEKLAAEVSGPCELLIVEGGNHVVNNLWYRYRDQTADWLATRLGVPKR